MKKLAIITTHPIQYNAPLFKLLTARGKIIVRVFYTWGEAAKENKFDPGFDKIIHWDLPLLEGYDYTFIENTATDPGSHHFKGIINPGLNNELQRWEPDAILVFGWSFDSHLKCLRYFHKKLPVFFRGDSTLLDEKPGVRNILRKIFLKWVYRHVDRAFYVGSKNKQYFLACGLQPAQLSFAPHAVDNERFAGSNDIYKNEVESIRKDLGIDTEDLVIMFAGKLEAKKNPLFLAGILDKIKDERLKLIFVGSGPLLPEIKSIASLDKRIVLMGFQNQQRMPVMYRLADLFILPSSGPAETWGLALNEAMACDRAVAASNKTGGAADLVENNVNGLIIDLKNEGPLEQLLQKALEDKSYLQEMGRQSGRKILDFTFAHIATAIETAMAP